MSFTGADPVAYAREWAKAEFESGEILKIVLSDTAQQKFVDYVEDDIKEMYPDIIEILAGLCSCGNPSCHADDANEEDEEDEEDCEEDDYYGDDEDDTDEKIDCDCCDCNPQESVEEMMSLDNDHEDSVDDTTLFFNKPNPICDIRAW